MGYATCRKLYRGNTIVRIVKETYIHACTETGVACGGSYVN